jgi:hypothetical protein
VHGQWPEHTHETMYELRLSISQFPRCYNEILDARKCIKKRGLVSSGPHQLTSDKDVMADGITVQCIQARVMI